jgi:hypothetical protein
MEELKYTSLQLISDLTPDALEAEGSKAHLYLCAFIREFCFY